MKYSRIGCVYVPIKLFRDSRGSFTELYRKSSLGNFPEFVQDNQSESAEGVVRGIHFQGRNPQGKLVRVTRGSVIDVAVDLRVGSPTYGVVDEFLLRPDDFAVYIPPGYGHGFWAITDATFHYKCTQEYDAESDGGINSLDPGVKYPWSGGVGLHISDKDRKLPNLAEFQSPFVYTPAW